MSKKWLRPNSEKWALWYLASPYTDDDPAVMQRRYEQVCQAAAGLMRRGYCVLSPIAHSHPIAQYGLPKEWGYWGKVDLMLLSCCDGLMILMLNGWDESQGIRTEIEYATEHNMAIHYEEIENDAISNGGE